MNNQLDEIESYLFACIENVEEFENGYHSSFDKVCAWDWVIYDFLNRYAKDFQTEEINAERIKEFFFPSFANLGGMVMTGCYLYADAGLHCAPLPDDSEAYTELEKWGLWEQEKIRYHSEQAIREIKGNRASERVHNGIPEHPTYTSFDQCFDIDLNEIYLSKKELSCIDRFSDHPNIVAQEDRKARKQAYRSYLDGNDHFDNLEAFKLLKQERRELILKGWLYGKGYGLGQNLRHKGYKRAILWDKLHQIDEELFHGLGEYGGEVASSTKKFFQDQKLCDFSLLE